MTPPAAGANIIRFVRLHRFAPVWRSPILVGAAALLYLLVPGHPGARSTGLPLSLEWLGVAAALLALLATLGRPSRRWAPLAVAILLLCVLKLGAWSVAIQPGLVARYHSFDEGQPLPTPERSTDFLWLRGATRLDQALDMSGENFPLFFFNNNQRWNSYKPSDTPHDELPFVVTWDGFLNVPADGEYRFRLSSEGPASISLDGVELLRTETRERSTLSQSIVLRAGLVPLHARYERVETGGRRMIVIWKGPGVNGELGSPYLLARTPSALSARFDSQASVLGNVADGLYLLALLALLAVLLWEHGRAVLAVHRGPRILLPLIERPALALVILFAFWQAVLLTVPSAGRMIYLDGGEDPLTRETQAREIALNGPLMTFDARPGKGKPYYSQILYPYFLTLTHGVVGESLSGVYLTQVALLGLLVVLVYLLGKRLFGTPVGLLAAALFGALVQQEYVRVALTLFAEDFYTPLIVAAVLALVIAFRQPTRWRLLAASTLLALAAFTRFTGMAFVPFVALLFWIEFSSRGWGRRQKLVGLGTLFSVLLVGLVLVCARNLVVASTLNPVPASLGNNLIKLHEPSDAVDLTATKSPLYELLGVDPSVRKVIEFARQDLGGYLEGVIAQALYAAGYTDLVSNGPADQRQTYHLGFFGATLLYLVAVLIAPRARTREALLLHAFVLSHWALMGIFFASQYRYRLILPMYPFIYVFAALAVWRTAELFWQAIAGLRARFGAQSPVAIGAAAEPRGRRAEAGR